MAEVAISIAASIAAKYLISLLEKPPESSIEPQITTSSYRRNIPKPYNYYRYGVNWIEPKDAEENAFRTAKKGKGKKRRKILYGSFLGAVCHGQTDLIALWLNGKGRYNALHVDPKALAAGLNFYNNEVDWLDGSYDQLPWWKSQVIEQEESLAIGKNLAIGYRGISCLGIRDIDLTEDLKTNTFADASCLIKTQTEYDLGAIFRDICQDSGIEDSNIETDEVDGIEVKGFSRPQDGSNYANSVEQLMLGFKIFPVETGEGKLSFRRIQRPGITLTISWQDFVPEDDGKLWHVEETDIKELPKTVSIGFIDPALEYQPNSVISDEQPGVYNQNEFNIDLPIVMDEPYAKALANWHRQQAWIRRFKYRFKLGLKYLNLFNIGDVLQLPGGVTTQVVNFTVGANYVVEVEGVGYDTKASSTPTATTGGNSSSSSIGEESSYNDDGTVNYGNLYLLDIPLADRTHSELGLYCFGDRENSTMYVDKGNGYEEILTFAAESVIGTCNGVLPAVANTNLTSDNLPILDSSSTLEISLDTGSLNNISQDAFERQEQLAFIGKFNGQFWEGEFVGIQNAELIGEKHYAIDTLQRGLKGTEYYIDRHTAGEKFFLLAGEEAYWERLLFTTDDIGKTFNAKLVVVSNQDLSQTPVTNARIVGHSLLPYAPVDISYAEDPDGNLVFSFTSRNRGEDNRLGETSDHFEIDLLAPSGNSVRTLTGTNPVIYPQAQKVIDNLGNSIDANIYKISSLVGRGHPGLIRALATSGTSNTVVANSSSQIFKGFRYISNDYTVVAEDDGYWLLVDASTSVVNITLGEIIAVNLWIQNVGENKVNLLGNLKAIDNVLRANEAIFLLNRNTVWHGQFGDRIEIPQHLIVNTDFTLAQIHHNKIVSVNSANTITVTLDETALINPQNFHTTIRKKGEGDVYFLVANDPASVLEAVGNTLANRYRAVYIGYEGAGVWIALGGLQ